MNLTLRTLAIDIVSFLILILLLLCFSVAFAEEGDSLGKTEKLLFGRDYASDIAEERLSRMETVVFGAAQDGNISERQTKIESVLSRNMVKPEPEQKQSGEALLQQSKNKSYPDVSEEPKAKDATDYPAVSQLEEHIFKHNYIEEPIEKRLSRLEQNLFKETFDELPMVDRVDQLTLKAMPDSSLGAEESTLGGLPVSSKEFTSGDLAVYSQLTALEEHVFGKSFGGDLISNRLTRLEKQVFGMPKKGTVNTRINNLISNYNPQVGGTPRGVPPSKQYKSYVTKTEAYNPKAALPYQPSVGADPRVRPNEVSPYPQQVIVGGAIGSQQYSEEFLNMLPESVRSQFGAGNSGGAVTGISPPQTGAPEFYNGPGTWTHKTEVIVPYIPNSLYRTPGQIYQGSPGTQIITPLPQQQPYQYSPYNQPGGTAFSYQPQALPNSTGTIIQKRVTPGSSGTVKQSLAMLEYHVFGRNYAGSNIGLRLNNLEQQIFGRTYQNLSYQQRINRLMRQVPFGQSSNPLNNNQDSGKFGMKDALGGVINMMMHNSEAGYTIRK